MIGSNLNWDIVPTGELHELNVAGGIRAISTADVAGEGQIGRCRSDGSERMADNPL